MASGNMVALAFALGTVAGLLLPLILDRPRDRTGHSGRHGHFEDNPRIKAAGD